MIMRSISVVRLAKSSQERQSGFCSSRWTRANRPRARRRVSCGRGAQPDDPFDIERRAGEDEERIDGREAAQFHFAQASNGLEPRKGSLDARPRMLTHRVARVSRRAGIDRAPTASGVVLRDVRGYVDFAHLLDEVDGVIRFVGPNRAAAAAAQTANGY